MNHALRCFVAMAVGRADTDRIYDKHIAPTLKAARIHPVFMGRLEHNDDIDKRIISEIEACDFAISDLTYARPSVYFEAGYAQRSVPVIYTCRADHFQSPARR
jgi:nucleoside 2-deoxyribosyltransferase